MVPKPRSHASSAIKSAFRPERSPLRAQPALAHRTAVTKRRRPRSYANSTWRELCRLSLTRDPDDPPRKTTGFETTDDPPARIDLEAAQAVERRRRERVVVVVPGLTEREPRKPPDVS